ncbi:hypothetical protein Cni_G14463 [Canna indica]|uniref:OVATE domain-containing protein n=1 Tax=Canna indica TaxID=4628 RepID=A0AAQ3KGF1_9LILI|nr:hypothetical protein Cni_G14463 [Canna indica]
MSLSSSGTDTDKLDSRDDPSSRTKCYERFFFSPHTTKSIMEEARNYKYSDTSAGRASSTSKKTSFYEESVMMAVASDNPYHDFRASMEEMVAAHQLREWHSLQELLHCYLRVNKKKNHRVIALAFVDLLMHRYIMTRDLNRCMAVGTMQWCTAMGGRKRAMAWSMQLLRSWLMKEVADRSSKVKTTGIRSSGRPKSASRLKIRRGNSAPSKHWRLANKGAHQKHKRLHKLGWAATCSPKALQLRPPPPSMGPFLQVREEEVVVLRLKYSIRASIGRKAEMSTSNAQRRRSGSFLGLSCGCKDSKSVSASPPSSSDIKSTTQRAREASSADTLTLTSPSTSSYWEELEAAPPPLAKIGTSSPSTPSFAGLLHQLNELEHDVMSWGKCTPPPQPLPVGGSRQGVPKKGRHKRSFSEGGARRVEESVAVVKETEDPLGEFRKSMLQMIVEKEIVDGEELLELLRRFLALNSPRHHNTILRAFAEIWDEVFSGYENTPDLLRRRNSAPRSLPALRRR